MTMNDQYVAAGALPPGCGSNTSPPTRCDLTSTPARRRQERRAVTAYSRLIYNL